MWLDNYTPVIIRMTRWTQCEGKGAEDLMTLSNGYQDNVGELLIKMITVFYCFVISILNGPWNLMPKAWWNMFYHLPLTLHTPKYPHINSDLLLVYSRLLLTFNSYEQHLLTVSTNPVLVAGVTVVYQLWNPEVFCVALKLLAVKNTRGSFLEQWAGL